MGSGEQPPPAVHRSHPSRSADSRSLARSIAAIAAAFTVVVAVIGVGVVARQRAASAAPTFPAGFVDETVVAGLDTPVAMSFAPDGRIFVALKRGVVVVVKDGKVLPKPFIDISDDVNNFFEHGMLGLTLDRNFPAQPYVYVLYVYDPPGVRKDDYGARVARVERITADLVDTDVAATGPTARRVLLGGAGDASTITDPTATPRLTCWRDGAPVADCIPVDSYRHTIGTVAMAPDGSLYVGNGDADRLPDGPRTVGSFVGSIMRIDPATGLGYPDNPFYDGDPTSNRSKVWAHGLRNPFRFGFHPQTGQLLIGDVGDGSWEEIDVGVKGADYGWPCREGNHEFGDHQHSAACSLLRTTATDRPPVYEWAHTAAGGSVTGGDWYLGSTYPEEYRGAYFFADYSQEWIGYLRPDGAGGFVPGRFASDIGPGDGGGIVAMAAGTDTNLYYLRVAGEIHRIRYTAAGNAAPRAVATVDRAEGGYPLTVVLDGSRSADPDGQPLQHRWDLADGTTAVGSVVTHTYLRPGSYLARLTVTDPDGATATSSVEVRVGTAATVTITSPAPGTTVPIGSTIDLRATALDPNAGDVTSSIEWKGTLHHNAHTHPDYLPPNTTGGQASVVFADHGDDIYLELCATVVSVDRLRTTRCVDVRPRTTTVTVTSIPPGVPLTYAGLTRPTPFTVTTVAGATRTVSAPSAQGCARFASWSDGGAITHEVVSAEPRTITATYDTTACEIDVVGRWRFDDPPGAVTAADSSGRGNTATLAGGARRGPGHDGVGLVLDGRAAHAVVAASPSLAGLDRALSVASWVRPDDLGRGDFRWIASRQFGPAWADQWGLGFLGDAPVFLVATVTGDTTLVLGPAVTAGDWVHLAGTFDGTMARLFVDGTEVASAAVVGPLRVDANPVVIGGNQNTPDAAGTPQELLTGVVDELRIVARALSRSEIRDAMQGDVPVPPPVTVPVPPAVTVPPSTTVPVPPSTTVPPTVPVPPATTVPPSTTVPPTVPVPPSTTVPVPPSTTVPPATTVPPSPPTSGPPPPAALGAGEP